MPHKGATWWGGQFDIMVGLVRQPLFKATGRANLTNQELEVTLLDIEIVLYNRQLNYIKDDIQILVLTSNTLLYWQPKMIPEEWADADIPEIERRQFYISKREEKEWKR